MGLSMERETKDGATPRDKKGKKIRRKLDYTDTEKEQKDKARGAEARKDKKKRDTGIEKSGIEDVARLFADQNTTETVNQSDATGNDDADTKRNELFTNMGGEARKTGALAENNDAAGDNADAERNKNFAYTGGKTNETGASSGNGDSAERNTATNEAETEKNANTKKAAEWREGVNDVDMVSEEENDLPPTPGKTPPKSVDKELERVSMLARAMEPTAPEVVQVCEDLRQMRVKKKPARDGGETSATAASSAGQREENTRKIDRIPKKQGGGDTNMSHRPMADRPEDAAKNRRREEERGKGRERRGRRFTRKEEEKRCYNCFKRGHVARFCRSERKMNNRKRRYESDSSDKEGESATQKKMKDMAKKLAKGATHYDIAMMAAAAMNIDKQ